MKFPLKYVPSELIYTVDADDVPIGKRLEVFDGDRDPIRAIERASIRWWMEQQAPYLTGRVLDFGCGKPGTCAVPQPYRDIVEKAGGQYVGWDLGDPWPVGTFDAVVINQVLEYMSDPVEDIDWLGFGPDEKLKRLKSGGYVLLTYAMCWPPTGEKGDWLRLMPAAIEDLMQGIRCTIEEHITRAVVRVAGREFPLGGACRCRKI